MNTTYNPKKVAVILALSTVVILILLTYFYILQVELKILKQKQIELMEENLKKENQIKKLEEQVKMHEFRATHLQELLDQEKLVSQEALKKLKWK